MKPYNEVNPTSLGGKHAKKRKLEKSKAESTNSTEKLQAEWPQSLLNFVNASFQRAESLDKPGKTLFNNQMQQLLYMAAKDHKIWTNPWERQRIPIFDSSATLSLAQDTPQPESPPTFSPRHEDRSHRKKNKKFDSNERKNLRAARFGSPEVGSSPTPIVDPSEPIIGYLKNLEKRYLRLTSAPDPSSVRPQNILEKSLDFVLDKFKNTNKQYTYINDQLKAIRQDLTVQHIKNGFSIRVYEINGRIAIENNDLGEFNQCLSQLRYLYNLNKDSCLYEQTYEFQCYRMLYFLLTGNKSGANTIILELLDQDKDTDVKTLPKRFQTHRECLYKTIDLLKFSTEGNYHQFFSIYKWFQKLASESYAFILLDKFMATKERLIAMSIMSKAYKKLPCEFIAAELGMTGTEDFRKLCEDFHLLEFLQENDFDCGGARFKLQSIIDQGQFKKVDIKGQV